MNGNEDSMILNKYYNASVTFLVDVWFSLTEPLALRIARLRSNEHNDDDLVSIIIATYNRGEILVNRTLPSVLAQTHNNIEVLVVGDKCIDDTAERMKSLVDARVFFHDLPKRGRYPSDIKDRWFVQGCVPRNAGMKLAKGKWFVFISDDDVLYPNHVATLLAAAKEKKVEFISASYETVKDGRNMVVHPNSWNVNSDLVCGGMQTWLYRSYLKCFKWNRQSWRKAYDRPVDYDLQQRFYRAGVRMDYIRDVVFYNPPVEGTNTTGYAAAIVAERINPIGR